MKKFLALILAMFMLISLVACDNGKQPADEQKPDTEANEAANADAEAPAEEVVEEDVDENGDAVPADEEPAEDEAKEQLGYEDPEEYTALGATPSSPNNWNPFTYESGVDADEVLGYITDSLWNYDFDPENLAVGYTIRLYQATQLPEDITKELAGDEKWGIPADATEGYAYRVHLRDDLMWDDGTPIDAETFRYSMEKLLDPKAQNLRADQWYNGGKILAGAKDYLYQGQKSPTPIGELAAKEGYESVDAYLKDHGDDPAQVNWMNSFGERYNAKKDKWTKKKVEDAIVDAKLSLNEMKDLFMKKVHGEWGEPEETAIKFFNEETFIDYTYPEVGFDTVGLVVEDPQTFYVVFARPLTGFDLYWNFRGVDLVKKDLYEANLSVKEGKEGEPALVTSTYGSSVDTTASYGPYKLVKFQDDKLVEFERNENWHGYKSGLFKGLYQTDKIKTTIVKEATTRLQMFLKGQLDGYGLTVDQVEEYRGSDNIYFTLGSYTPCLNFCENAKALEARQQPGLNKTILSIKDFRKALILAIDREDLVAQNSASNLPGYGLLNSRYIADTENVIPFRNFDEAKENLVKFYGLEYGEGKDYANLEEAYEAMTGYDLEKARELVDQAYAEALDKELIKEGDKVSLDLYFAEDNETVRKYYNYFKNAWEKLMEGTKLEGKFELNLDATAGNDFGKNFRNGLSDIMLAGWQGATFDPWYLLGAYIQEQYRYDAVFNVNKPVTVELGGKEVTLTLEEWYLACQGQDPDHDYSKLGASMEDRLKILAAMEFAIMDEYVACPVMYASSASLRSYKVNYLTDDFNELMGYGSDVGYLTYNYTDAEWEQFVKDQGGELDYK